jgi:hypothetical protein
VANRSQPRRSRSRKRRPAAVEAAAVEAAAAARAGGEEGNGASVAGPAARARESGGPSARVEGRAGGGGERRERPKARRAHSSPAAPTYGERPPAPWHPLPLSEILILVGAIVAVIGFKRLHSDGPGGAPTLIAGIAAVAIGTFEVTLREHRSGYRSHTIMLALLPVLVFDSLVVLVISLFTSAPRLLSVGLLALDIVLFAVMFRMLRARFLDARHARVLREG